MKVWQGNAKLRARYDQDAANVNEFVRRTSVDTLNQVMWQLVHLSNSPDYMEAVIGRLAAYGLVKALIDTNKLAEDDKESAE